MQTKEREKMAIRRVIKKQEETSINPFEIRDNSEQLMASLATIDRKDIRHKFSNVQDPFNLAFEAVADRPLKTLAKEFVKDGFNDLISWVKDFCD